MTAHSTRRDQDIQKLQALSNTSGGKVRILSISGVPPNAIEVELNYPTAGDKNYPKSVQKSTKILLELGARYPFTAPSVMIKTPIIHPNVYPSGQVCLGSKWLPTHGLDLLVKRLISIITYDSSILNESSPANRDAVSWYNVTHRANPASFPTTNIMSHMPLKTTLISWSNTK